MRYPQSFLVLTVLAVSSFTLAGCYSTQIDDNLDFPSQIDDLSTAPPQEETTPSIEGDISMSDRPVSAGQAPAGQQPVQLQEETLPQEINQFERVEQQPGTGTPAQAGDTITVHYTGMLTSGQVFDTSLKRGQPFSFQLGSGQVIQGWDQGLIGAQQGGKYRLLIPSAMGYGERGAGAAIPPNADLIFDVEVLSISK